MLEPASLTCACGGCLHCIEDVSERRDIVPAQFRVIVARRPRHACRSCTDGVTQAPAPARLIPGGMPTEAMDAQGPVSQICRSSAALSSGSDLQPSGRCPRPFHPCRLGRACRLTAARPVYDALLADLKRSTKLFMDETRAPVPHPGARKTTTG